MSNEDEVLRIAKKLDKMVAKKNADSALDVLRALKKIPIGLETLKKTRIGMSVNSIRKQTKNDEVAAAAKQLIKGWKKLVGNEDANANGTKKAEDKKSEDRSDPDVSTTIQKEKMPQLSCPKIEMETSSSMTLTNDPVRDKCREMLLRGLLADGESEFGESRCTFIAAAIEDAVFAEFKNTGMKYKNRIRSRFSNLKDPKNISLRKNVLSGVVKPEKLSKMTAEEMASDEMKKMREQFEQENIKDHQMAVNEGTKTDMFTCGRCKGKACTYSQLQTRSSDEPMTTFVFCTDCGNRWKFC